MKRSPCENEVTIPKGIEEKKMFEGGRDRKYL